MIKIKPALSLVGSLVVLLAGCGDSSSDSGADTAASADGSGSTGATETTGQPGDGDGAPGDGDGAPGDGDGAPGDGDGAPGDGDGAPGDGDGAPGDGDGDGAPGDGDGAPGDGDGAPMCASEGESCANQETCCEGTECCQGVPVPPGQEYCGAMCPISDRNKKQGFASVDSQWVLEQVVELPISTWSYKDDEQQARHIGPMAQDFRAAFAVGGTDRFIFQVDADGVSLAAIQALHARAEALDAENQRLRAELGELEARLARLEARLEQ